MQPDNEKIIEAIAGHEAKTKVLMAELLQHGATSHTLGAIVQVLQVLEQSYAQPNHGCCGAIIGNRPIGMAVMGRRRTDDDFEVSPELEKILAEAIRKFEARQNEVIESEN